MLRLFTFMFQPFLMDLLTSLTQVSDFLEKDMKIHIFLLFISI